MSDFICETDKFLKKIYKKLNMDDITNHVIKSIKKQLIKYCRKNNLINNNLIKNNNNNQITNNVSNSLIDSSKVKQIIEENKENKDCNKNNDLLKIYYLLKKIVNNINNKMTLFEDMFKKKIKN